MYAKMNYFVNFISKFNTQHINALNMQELLLEVSETKIEVLSSLILHNDDVNTFDDVIDAIVEICKHSREQAEQCSLFIHYQGKYTVKNASYNQLKPMKEAFLERSINATIE